MTRRKLNNWNRIVLALGLMLLAETLAAAQTLQRVVIAYPSRSIGSIHSFIALERGFFREEGLDAQLVQVRGTAAVAATVSGDAHALEAMGTAMGAIQRGLPLRILAVSLYRPLFWLVTRPQLKTAHDLNGRIMGTTTFGGVQPSDGLAHAAQAGHESGNGHAGGRRADPAPGSGDGFHRYGAAVSSHGHSGAGPVQDESRRRRGE
jgi:ABC-type nitrate/sulfonate/bicarbonate transport system substrate-binding protein